MRKEIQRITLEEFMTDHLPLGTKLEEYDGCEMTILDSGLEVIVDEMAGTISGEELSRILLAEDVVFKNEETEEAFIITKGVVR